MASAERCCGYPQGCVHLQGLSRSSPRLYARSPLAGLCSDRTETNEYDCFCLALRLTSRLSAHVVNISTGLITRGDKNRKAQVSPQDSGRHGGGGGQQEGYDSEVGGRGLTRRQRCRRWRRCWSRDVARGRNNKTAQEKAEEERWCPPSQGAPVPLKRWPGEQQPQAQGSGWLIRARACPERYGPLRPSPGHLSPTGEAGDPGLAGESVAGRLLSTIPPL